MPAQEAFTPSVSHLAGNDAAVTLDEKGARQVRQRCVWCGCLLVDRRMDTDEGDDPVWEPGGIVRHDLDADVWYPIPGWDEDKDDLPDDSCMLLPLELTGSAGPGR